MSQPDGVELSVRLPGPRRLRIGAFAAGALLVVLGTAVALGASPAPPGSTTADPQAPSAPQGFGPMGGEGGERGSGLGHRRHPGGGGPVVGPITVKAISGSSVSLGTADGWARTISVTEATSITKGGEPVGLSALRVGDQVRIRQSRADDGTFLVTAIDVVVPRLGGIVTGVTGSGFTVSGRGGVAKTITVTSDTTYRLGDSAGTKADVKVGVAVMATGTSSGDTFTATKVMIAVPRVAGQVTARDGSSLTLTLRDGTSALVRVDGSTTFRVRGVGSATLADVELGMFAIVVGARSSDGSIDADAVHVGAGQRAMRDGGPGLTPGMGRRDGLGPGFGPGFGPGTAPGAGQEAPAGQG